MGAVAHSADGQTEAQRWLAMAGVAEPKGDGLETQTELVIQPGGCQGVLSRLALFALKPNRP